ncbi:hypothetical protein MSG28_014447 [Choristoneura fumiferana]|uniref:Uncharacterized protein n=1 Tax=Choristoneura fumiferana TaxID=7141 RepID=A0ACC0JRH2_CHOFU|nr:hypothetical protein MSG28_014447 [Choristoneura fumiferana]
MTYRFISPEPRSETAAMKPTRKYYLFLLLALAFYFTTSKLIFDKVHDTTQIVIDELFHIPQGIAYCQRMFRMLYEYT